MADQQQGDGGAGEKRRAKDTRGGKGIWFLRGISEDVREAVARAATEDGVFIGKLVERMLVEALERRTQTATQTSSRPTDADQQQTAAQTDLVELPAGAAERAHVAELRRQMEALAGRLAVVEGEARLALDNDASLFRRVGRLEGAASAQDAPVGASEPADGREAPGEPEAAPAPAAGQGEAPARGELSAAEVAAWFQPRAFRFLSGAGKAEIRRRHAAGASTADIAAAFGLARRNVQKALKDEMEPPAGGSVSMLEVFGIEAGEGA